MRGRLPSTLPVPARESPRRLAANARAAVMDKMADQRSARAEMHAARKGAGTARARQRASRRTKVAASEPHRPPISTPRTVRWQRREATSSGYARSLARRATWRAEHTAGVALLTAERRKHATYPELRLGGDKGCASWLLKSGAGGAGMRMSSFVSSSVSALSGRPPPSGPVPRLPGPAGGGACCR